MMFSSVMVVPLYAYFSHSILLQPHDESDGPVEHDRGSGKPVSFLQLTGRFPCRPSDS
jgi:hypothetical protein